MTTGTDGNPSLSDLWREFCETGAALDDDEVELDDPLQIKHLDTVHAIVAARPTDMAGLAVQMQYFQRLVDGGCSPNHEEAEMMAHVARRLAAMAGHKGDDAGPLSSTF
jgi:hypothetical protein